MDENNPFRKSFEEIFQEYEGEAGEFEESESPLTDEIDRSILMHREAHFGGSFSAMLDYYSSGGVGASREFELERIERLAQAEEEADENLAPYLLSGSDAERVGRARRAYRKLRDLYEAEEAGLARLIADLILSEEEEPEEETAAIVARKKLMIPYLIDLLRSEEFFDPLFPGYGRAPYLAAKCLGRIGDKSAIAPLFELLGAERFFDEEELILALKALGEPAKEFLLQRLSGRPIRPDTERAAIALGAFSDDPRVAEASFDLLEELDFKAHPELASYLFWNCASLKDPAKRELFKGWLSERAIPEFVKSDLEELIKGWD